MSAARLLELLNREAVDSGRNLVVLVNGEEPVTIEAGRSINLAVDTDGVFLWIGRKAAAMPTDLPEGIRAIVEGDTLPPTGEDEANGSHIELLPDAQQAAMWAAPLMPGVSIALLSDTSAEAAQLQAELDAAIVRGAELDAEIAAHQALTDGANIHGIGPDTDGGPNPHYNPNADGADRIELATVQAVLDSVPDSAGQPPALDDATVATAYANGESIGATINDGNPLLQDTADTTVPETVVVSVTREGLEAMTFAQLREIADGMGIKGRAKAELVREILAATEAK